MKKVKKAIMSVAIIGLFASCLVVPALASSYYNGEGGSFTGKYSTSTKYFNSIPANKIRFIFVPTCNINSAQVQVELHKRAQIAPVNETQIIPVNLGQQRPWWNTTDAYYHVQLHALNNSSSTSGKVAIFFEDYWFENFLGYDPWV